jgi:hypothetical protein
MLFDVTVLLARRAETAVASFVQSSMGNIGDDQSIPFHVTNSAFVSRSSLADCQRSPNMTSRRRLEIISCANVSSDCRILARSPDIELIGFHTIATGLAMLPLLALVARSLVDGQHFVKVTNGRPFQITLTSQILILQIDELPDQSIAFTSVESNNSSDLVPLTSFANIQLSNTTFSVSVPASGSFFLNFWLIPSTFCPGGLYSVMADRRVSFEFSAHSIPSEVCIFSQADASSYDLVMHPTSGDPQVEFYTTPQKPRHQCAVCSFNSGEPFVLRLLQNVAPVTFQFDLTVFRQTLQFHRCGFGAIPLFQGGAIVATSGPLASSGPFCLSMAEAALKYIIVGVLGFVVMGLVLWLLHGIGFLDLSVICSFSNDREEFASLHNDRYADVFDPEPEPDPKEDSEEKADA